MKPKKSRITSILQVMFAISIVVFLLYIELVGRRYPNSTDHMESVDFIGTYQESEQSMVYDLNDANRPDAESLHQILLKGHFSRDIPQNVKLFMYVNRVKVQIKQNGNIIFTYGEADAVPSISKSIGVQWANFNSMGIKATDDIEINISLIYERNYKEAYETFLDSLCTGNRYALLAEQIKNKIGNISISLIIFLAGLQLLATLVSFQMMRVHVPVGSISCGLLMISGAVCTFIDYRYITLLFENSYFINILDNVSQLLICECLALYLSSYLRTRKFIVISELVSGVWTFMTSMYLLLQCTGMADGQDLIFFYIPLAIVVIVIIAIFMLLDAKKYSEKQILSVLFAGFVLTIAAVIELIHYYLNKTFMIRVFQMGLLYFTASQLVLLLKSAKRDLEQMHLADELEKELMENRISIMMSQIQPHFLYNTLTSIQELCLTAPEKAYDAISWFAQFLRGNMDSLSTTELITFEKELHHVKNYLRLEVIRYGELLNVEYEIGVSDFKLPALSVQPIVENAVRYGLSQKEEGGTVRIETYEKNGIIKIRVKDDGVGFEKNTFEEIIYKDKINRTHIGMENVTKRIQQQCGGYVKVTSKYGIGTEVMIHIPRERAK